MHQKDILEFIANSLNGNFLRNILPTSSHEIDGVFAAIAYGSNFPSLDDDLIGNCLKNRHRLDLWMRYDHTVPVTPSLLRRILRHHKDNIFCKLVPDCFHSKVIWWKGYGAYIGSANHTDRAWVTNIEAGIFLTDADLQKDNMQIEIENFFETLRNTDECFPLSLKIIEELEVIQSQRKNIFDLGKSLRSVPVWESPVFIERKKAIDKRKESFRKEWDETLSHLEAIGRLLKGRRPIWVKEDVPIQWQIDQFLHAYYYNKVGDSLKKPYEDFYIKNHENPNRAVNEAITWWESTTKAPSEEDVTFYKNAPLIKQHLSSDTILSLSDKEFSEVYAATHATKDHIIKMDLGTLGRPDLTTMSRDERIPLFASWLLKQRNKKGWSVLQLLDYVFSGGRNSDLWNRLYTATKDPDYLLPHYGLNSIAELVGWALPEIAPPRNGRTSKALKALGFDVKIY